MDAGDLHEAKMKAQKDGNLVDAWYLYGYLVATISAAELAETLKPEGKLLEAYKMGYEDGKGDAKKV